MRIAVAAHTRGRVGGVENHLATVIPSLARAGHDVACWFEMAGGGSEPILGPTAGITTWTAAEEAHGAVDRLRAWRPDVVYVHGIGDPALERALVDVAPAVLFAHSYYGTCISGSKTLQTPEPHACTRAFGAACLAQYFPRRCGGRNPITMLQHYGLQRSRFTLLDRYARILVASRHMEREYARHGLESRVRVVHLPIESRIPAAAAREGSDAWRLLYLGRLESAKGADIAVESAARVAESTARPVHLQMAGEGSMRGALEARAAQLTAAHGGLRVTFSGWLDERASAAAIDQSDLLLVPSRWPEPFGMVGVEAGLRGVPAVAFAVGGIPEWLEDGVTGRLVPADPPDVQRFADAIRSCLSEPVLQPMREKSRAAAARFTVAAHLGALEGVFSEVASSRASAASPGMSSPAAGNAR